MPDTDLSRTAFAPGGQAFENHLLRSIRPSLALTGRAQSKLYRAGEVIFHSHREQTCAAFPEVGVVAIRAVSLDGVTPTVGFVGPEGVLGLAAALSGAINLYDAVAVTDVKLTTIPAAALRGAAATDPDLMTAIFTCLAAAEERTRAAVACATFHSGSERVADCLLQLADKLDADRVPVTQEDIAAALGLSRTTVTALLAQLTRADMLRQGRGWIGILQRDHLTSIACGCAEIGRSPRCDLQRSSG